MLCHVVFGAFITSGVLSTWFLCNGVHGRGSIVRMGLEGEGQQYGDVSTASENILLFGVHNGLALNEVRLG